MASALLSSSPSSSSSSSPSSSPSPCLLSSRLSACGRRVSFLRVLPLAVCVSVVSYLPLPSVASASCVSALLFALCQDDRVWRALCAGRWRPLQNARALLTAREWAALYGDDDDDAEEEAADDAASGDEKDADDADHADDSGRAAGEQRCRPEPMCDAELAGLSWKERYILAEVDLCRSYLSLSEVCSARWAFRFLPNALFDDRSQTTFPRFTASRLLTGLDAAYDWRFVDTERDMPARARERGEMSAYERRRFMTAEQVASSRTADRPYWLRSSGTATPPPPTAAQVANAASRSDSDSSTRSAGCLQLSASSALLSPSLPPYRFRPSHPFFGLSDLQLLDCSTERRLQVSHFPALSISRLPDGGWQLLNQYVVMRTM